MFGLDGLACQANVNPVEAAASCENSPLKRNSVAVKAARGRRLVKLWKLWLMH